jgi:hypothetical protein
MQLTERSVVSLVEVTPNGTIQVRISNQIMDGETIKAESFHRYLFPPGSDLTGQPGQVVTIANGVWTPEVIAAYQAQLATNIQPGA